MHTAELDSVVNAHPKSDFTVRGTQRSLTLQWDEHRRVFFQFEYLGEIETEFENTLAY